MPLTCTKDFSKSATYLLYQHSIISVNEWVHHIVPHEVTCTKDVSKSATYSMHQVSVISFKKMSLSNSVYILNQKNTRVKATNKTNTQINHPYSKGVC